MLIVSIFKNWGWWVSARFLENEGFWSTLAYWRSAMKYKKELTFPHIEMKMCEAQYTGYLFSGRGPLRLDMLETQMWMSSIFNNFPLHIISLSKQKIGKGLYCKSLFKPIYLHFYKSEIFYKRMVLSKTSTLWLCSGVKFTWQIQQITWHFCKRMCSLQPLVIIASSKRHEL